MSSTSVSWPSAAATTTSLDSLPAYAPKTLGQDEFLKILVAQMTSQDPMEPTSNSDFIGQMATFSSLEQTKAMQSDIAGLRADQEVLQANALLGRMVKVQVDKDTTTYGVVGSVHVEAGKPKVMVDDKVYDMDQIIDITPSILTETIS